MSDMNFNRSPWLQWAALCSREKKIYKPRTSGNLLEKSHLEFCFRTVFIFGVPILIDIV